MTNPNQIESFLEKELYEFFPNYIQFRERFLIPLTGAPINPNWRIDTHPDLEQIGVGSYGILKSICFIQHRKKYVTISDFEQSFKNIYFHFGLIFDCVELISRNIILIEKEIGLIDIEKKLKISEEKLNIGFQEWIKNDYDKKFIELIEKGKPIFYYPQNERTFLSLIIKNPIKREYNKFAKSIKDYRNFFIHNPGVDVFIDFSSNNLYAIKKEYVEYSKNWANLQIFFEIKKDYFEEPTLMIDKDIKKLYFTLNEIWKEIISRLEIIYVNKNFEKIFKGYNRELNN